MKFLKPVGSWLSHRATWQRYIISNMLMVSWFFVGSVVASLTSISQVLGAVVFVGVALLWIVSIIWAMSDPINNEKYDFPG